MYNATFEKRNPDLRLRKSRGVMIFSRLLISYISEERVTFSISVKKEAVDLGKNVPLKFYIH